MTFDEWWRTATIPKLSDSQSLEEVVYKVCREAWEAALESARPVPSMKQWNSRSLSTRVSMMNKMIKAVKEKKSE